MLAGLGAVVIFARNLDAEFGLPGLYQLVYECPVSHREARAKRRVSSRQLTHDDVHLNQRGWEFADGGGFAGKVFNMARRLVQPTLFEWSAELREVSGLPASDHDPVVQYCDRLGHAVGVAALASLRRAEREVQAAWAVADMARREAKLEERIKEAHRSLVRAEKKAARNPWVYLMSDGERLKIGTSVHPEKRAIQLQSTTGLDVRVLHTVPGGARLERRLHRAFAELRTRGEWFEMSDEILAVFRLLDPGERS